MSDMHVVYGTPAAKVNTSKIELKLVSLQMPVSSMFQLVSSLALLSTNLS